MAGREHLSLVQDATGNGQQFFKTERGSLPCVPQQVTSKENTDNGAILQQPEGESVAPVTKVAAQIRRRHISHVPEDDVGKKDDKDGKFVISKSLKVDQGDQGCFERRIRDLEQENTELKITVNTLKSDKLELLKRLDVEVKERQTSEKTVLENNETICALKRSLSRANRRYEESEYEQDRMRDRMRQWSDNEDLEKELCKDYRVMIELFECPVCWDYALPPIQQCRNGHIACQSCLTKCINCPECRIPLENIRNLAMEKIAPLLNFPCKFSDNGCSATLLLTEIRGHENTCEHRNE